MTAAILGHGIEKESAGEEGGWGTVQVPLPLGMRSSGASAANTSVGGSAGTPSKRPEWKMTLHKAPNLFKPSTTGREPVLCLLIS